MKLRRLKADGFGLLRGEWQFDPSRLNLVIDENERGKTSLLHAIVAGLYGLDGDGRRHRGLITPLERWRPWNGGSYRVELEIESEGDTFTITRDFTRGTVEVWNERGQNVTPDFATEKDGFSVGLPMLGLDVDEFTKCAFWRQGELADVVPDQERDRRASTLQARLESAADTRAGDASAIEATQALDAALKAFESPELGTTLTIDNAIKRLEGLRDTLTVEIRSLEHDYGAIAGPLEQIAGLDDGEHALRTRLLALNARAAALRSSDAERRLERDAQRRAEIATLRAEVEQSASLASVPADAETALSAQAARHVEIAASGQATGARRREAEAELDRADQALAAYADLAGQTAADADTLAVQAGELRRSLEQLEQVRQLRDAGLRAMQERGLDPERAATLLPRFEPMTLEQADLLREQPRIALAQQTEIATAEQLRSTGRTVLRDIAAWKHPRTIGGGVLVTAGMACIALAFLPGLAAASGIMRGVGVLAALAGVATLVGTALARRGARDEARARLADADEQLRQTQGAASENDARLQAVAKELEYEGAEALLDEWGEAQRLRDLHAPIHAATQQLAVAERQHAVVASAAAALLGDDAPGDLDSRALEQAAVRIRARVALEQDRGELARRLEQLRRELTAHETAVAEAAQAAMQIIRSAGLEYEPGASWSAWKAEVGAQVRRSLHRQQLIERDIPALEADLMDDRTLAALRSEIERARAGAETAPAADVAAVATMTTPAEVDSKMSEAQGRLEGVRDARETLRRTVQNVADTYHARHPDAVARLEVVERELRRAEGFRAAVLHARATLERVARDTHRRWAEFLNQRVTDLLKDVGSSVSHVRFGEDLDFSVTHTAGQQTARGKAVHQLSSGARDQLHLVVRLAISEFLSRGGESLPLLIDDCFATSDDDRTRLGMRMLIDSFSRQNQVVFVTCHRSRHEALAALDPALYGERVHWLELRAAVGAGV